MILYKVFKFYGQEWLEEYVKYYINKIKAEDDFNRRIIAESFRRLDDLSYPKHLNKCIMAAWRPSEEGGLYIKMEEIETEDE